MKLSKAIKKLEKGSNKTFICGNFKIKRGECGIQFYDYKTHCLQLGYKMNFIECDN